MKAIVQILTIGERLQKLNRNIVRKRNIIIKDEGPQVQMRIVLAAAVQMKEKENMISIRNIIEREKKKLEVRIRTIKINKENPQVIRVRNQIFKKDWKNMKILLLLKNSSNFYKFQILISQVYQALEKFRVSKF